VNENVHNAKHRRILQRKWVDGVTYERLAEDEEMSVRGVQYMVARYKKQMR
jgi:hypothetical protein